MWRSPFMSGVARRSRGRDPKAKCCIYIVPAYIHIRLTAGSFSALLCCAEQFQGGVHQWRDERGHFPLSPTPRSKFILQKCVPLPHGGCSEWPAFLSLCRPLQLPRPTLGCCQLIPALPHSDFMDRCVCWCSCVKGKATAAKRVTPRDPSFLPLQSRRPWPVQPYDPSPFLSSHSFGRKAHWPLCRTLTSWQGRAREGGISEKRAIWQPVFTGLDILKVSRVSKSALAVVLSIKLNRFVTNCVTSVWLVTWVAWKSKCKRFCVFDSLKDLVHWNYPSTIPLDCSKNALSAPL